MTQPSQPQQAGHVTDEMVERAARAIYEMEGLALWEAGVARHWKRKYLDTARVALTAALTGEQAS